MAIRYGVDTNILLRASRRDDPLQSLVAESMRRLEVRGIALCFTPQNIGEFWNVSTRPMSRNGFGLTTSETDEVLKKYRLNMTLLHDGESVFERWLHLLQVHDVRGVQVHDAHLAAALEVHGIAHLLTFNGADFKRFPKLIPIHPKDVQP